MKAKSWCTEELQDPKQISDSENTEEIVKPADKWLILQTFTKAESLKIGQNIYRLASR